jgi:hypothetical protein
VVIYIRGKVYKTTALKALLTLAVLACVVGVSFADDDFRLYAYPNPFVAGYAPARLVYFLPASSFISLYVYDLEGNTVRTLVEKAERPAGAYNGQDVWDGRDDGGEFVPAGAYLIVLDVRTRGETLRDTFIAVVDR